MVHAKKLNRSPSGRTYRASLHACACAVTKRKVVNDRRPFTLAMGLALWLASASTLAIKPPLPRTKAQLAGTWAGPDAWGAVLRLELNGTGQGRLVIRGIDSNAGLDIYEISLTRIKVNELSFVVSPISKGAPEIALSGTNETNAIGLIRYLKNFGDGYGVRAILIRQSDLQSALQELEAADSGYSADHAR